MFGRDGMDLAGRLYDERERAVEIERTVKGFLEMSFQTVTDSGYVQ